ncbi:MAG: hypothetical protein QG608_3125 [Actinomycetota bacterium]|nr:hypothetical protein [Actinomycetota bacterium]
MTVAEQVAGRRVAWQPLPLLVQLGLTYRCPLRCTHCYASGRTRRAEMTSTQVESLAHRLHDAGTVSVVYSHGENLLRQDFHRIAGVFQELRLHQTLMSNGLPIHTAAHAEALVAAGVRRCLVSVDSPDPQVHDAVRGRTGAHGRALRAVDLLVAAGMPVVGFSTAIGPHNHRDVACLVDLAVAHGCTAVSLMPHRDTAPGDRRNTGGPWDVDRRGTCAALYEVIVSKRGVIDVYTHDPFMLGLLDDRLDGDGRRDFIDANLCNVGTSMVSVDPVGDVRACNFLPDVHGNVLAEPFAAIWDRIAQDSSRLRSRIASACSTCGLAMNCGGGCPAHRPDHTVPGCPYRPWTPQPAHDATMGAP